MEQESKEALKKSYGGKLDWREAPAGLSGRSQEIGTLIHTNPH
jgi:hypothetical protein